MRKYIIRMTHFLNLISLALLLLSGCASEKQRACIEKQMQVWDTVEDLADVKSRILARYLGAVFSLDISPDGKHLIAGSSRGIVKIWNLETGVEKLSLNQCLSPGVRQVAFSPDGCSFAAVGYNSGLYDQKIKLCDSETGSERIKLENSKDFCTSAVFSSDGKYLLGADTVKGGVIKIWDAASGKLMMQFQDKGPCTLSSIARSPDGKRFVTGSSIRDVESREKTATLRGPTLKCPWYLSFSPDGRQIVSGHHDGTIQLWDSKDGSEIKSISGHEGRVYSVAFSPSGKRIASAGADKTIKIWDTAKGWKITTLYGHEGMVFSVAFGLDGRQIVSSSGDGTVRIWELANQK
jgi:WD40 repeat protein